VEQATAFHEELGGLAEAHREALLKLACRITRDRETAKDALQEALLSAVEHKDSFLGLASLKTYLTRLVINKCIDANRRQGRWRFFMSLVQKEDLYPEQEAAEPGTGRIARIREMVNLLPDRYRIPLVLVEYEEMSYQEVSDILKISLSAVRMRIFKARERLRAMAAKERWQS
jgi:RNA polymerase sigma-70 factor, ECF subfamily